MKHPTIAALPAPAHLLLAFHMCPLDSGKMFHLSEVCGVEGRYMVLAGGCFPSAPPAGVCPGSSWGWGKLGQACLLCCQSCWAPGRAAGPACGPLGVGHPTPPIRPGLIVPLSSWDLGRPKPGQVGGELVKNVALAMAPSLAQHPKVSAGP